MFTRRFAFLCMAVATLGFSAHVSNAAELSTTIQIQGMSCGGCAAKVSRQLQAIPGVASTQADAEKAMAQITPQTNASPSPKAMWEAVEKAGYKPTKLVGPSGTFTEKPKS